MSTVQTGDTIAVYRSGKLYKAPADMSTLQDTDIIVVGRGNTPYKCSFLDWKNSQSKPPAIGSVTLADVAGGDRFTSQAFPVTVVMTEDGTPASAKKLKAWVEGKLLVYPQTDPITKIVATPGDDGAHWTSLNSGSSNDWNAGAGDDASMAILVGDSNKISWSTDGVTWHAVASLHGSFKGAVHGGGFFYACGFSSAGGGEPAYVMRSPDGKSWGDVYTGPGHTTLTAIAVNERTGVVITCGQNGHAARSTNGGTSFSDFTIGSSGLNCIAVDSLHNTWVIGGNGEVHCSTDDGATWSVNRGFINTMTAVNNGGGLWIAGNDNGDYWTTKDPASGVWTKHSPLIQDQINRVRMMSGVWWMGFDHRKHAPHPVVFRSIDGVTWAKTTAQPFADDVRAFCYLPGMVVAAGNNGNAARTTASTTSFEFASNTAFSNLTVGAPVTESGNGDDGKGNIVSLYPTSTPPYMQIAGITGTWDVGSRISAPPVQSATTTRLYCTLNGTGGVTNLQSADPGYTTVAGASPYHVTFPATLPSGDAPDADLPAGTTLTTEVQATNSAGTVTKASNTVTPA